MSRFEFLAGVPAFRSLSDSDRALLAEQFEEISFTRDDAILSRGEEGDAMYVVRDGDVDVVVSNPDGREMLTVRLGPREIFGEMALLTGETRTADVRARGDVTCLRLRREPFRDLIRRNTGVATFLSTILGQRLLEGENIRSVGKYRITGELGEGGASYVFEARHETLGTAVAIKMLDHELVYDERFASRFMNESKIMATLRHENIVRVIDHEQAYATFFIIMEKVDGVDLRKILNEQGRLSFSDTRSILRQLAAALEHAHARGIVHRDVKPGNVLVTPSGRVKVTDFGIAQTREGKDGPEENVSGTPKYLSPEQARGEEVDGRSDVYSLGILAYEMLTGYVPFMADSPAEVMRMHLRDPVPPPGRLRPDVPDDLETLVARATAKRPADRFESAADVVRHLDARGEEGLDPTRARRRSLTVEFDRDLEPKLDGLFRKWAKKAGKFKGCIVRLEEDPPRRT
ncbi:MAG: protein kinase [Planctomycetota bacterium JB042]